MKYMISWFERYGARKGRQPGPGLRRGVMLMERGL